jgi:hypothetical protein
MIYVVLYVHGPSLSPFLIRLIQGNKYTHCSLILEPNLSNPEDSIILEITRPLEKSRIGKLKDTLNNDKEITFASIQGNLLPFDPKEFLNKKYNMKIITNALINHLFGRIFDNYTYKSWLKPDEDKYICSSIIAHILSKYSTIDKSILNADLNVTEPDDYTKKPWILTNCLKENLKLSRIFKG